MNTIDAILTRKSIRKFSDEALDEETLNTILEAGMSAPTACNKRDYEFILVTDEKKLSAMAEANGPAANPLKEAKAAILICGNLKRAYDKAPDFWIIDGAAAAENIALAAQELGVGCVYIGTWPVEKKVNGQRELFSLPEHIIPHTIMALGYPKDPEELLAERESRYEEELIHREEF